MKAFLEEQGSELVASLLSAAEDPAATSRIAYVECQAAFARGGREGRIPSRQLSEAARSLDRRWADLVIIELDGEIAGAAGRIAFEYPLRAGDAIHLASALANAEGAPRNTTFVSWDIRLWEAASELGFAMAPPTSPT